MKLIIAGGRDFDDLHKLHEVIAAEFNIKDIKEVISGGADGADLLGELWAETHQIPIRIFQADWKKHGKAAGPIRNAEMAIYADEAVVFWDGESRGSKNMIENMKKLNKSVTVSLYS